MPVLSVLEQSLGRIRARFGFSGRDVRAGRGRGSAQPRFEARLPSHFYLPVRCSTARRCALQPGETMRRSEVLTSASDEFTLAHLHTGGLVLYRNADGMRLWNAQAQQTSAAVCVMQHDGNLVVFDVNRRAVWQSGTQGNPGAMLILQDDGNAVIYSPDNEPLWATRTRLQ